MASKQAKGSVPQSTSSSLINQPGVFMTIPCDSLKVDTEYQRPITGSRVDRIANDWSWIACGVITVALRGPGSGDYYVIDGQHRVESAKRAGIPELPCMVFESQEHTDEAQGFLDTNTNRKSMSILDKYRALLVINDFIAIKARELLILAGRDPTYRGTGTPEFRAANLGKSFTAIDYLMTAIKSDTDALERIWPLMIELTDGRLLTKRLLQGMFYIERYLSNASITERLWRRRILSVGYDLLHKSIDETCAFEGKSGSAICAQGILRALNKGLRNKLKIEVTPQTTTEE